MLVLASDSRSAIGVDVESGALVRAMHPGGGEALAPFDVATAAIGYPVDPPDPACPEAVELVTAPRRIGRLRPRRAERYLAPLQHPPHGPLLGFAAVAVPYWTVAGDRPSMALVKPSLGPQLRPSEYGVECRFAWQGIIHQLPLADGAIVSRFEQLERPRVSGRELARILGYRPRYLLVTLGPPDNGYCYKQVAAMIPGV